MAAVMTIETLKITLAIACTVVGIANLLGATWFAISSQWLPFGLSLSSFLVLGSLIRLGVFG